VKKILLSTLATLLIGAVAVAPTLAQAPVGGDNVPLLVLSLPSYNELKRDIDFLGELGEVPNASDMLEQPLVLFTQGQGLAGLNKDRPIGASLVTDAGGFRPLVFIPVEDLQQLLGVLAPLIGSEPEDAGDDVWRLQAGFTPVFIKQHGDWAFVAQSAEALANLPDDPTTLLGGLDKQHDIAIRVHLQNVPPMFRQLAFGQIRQGMEMSLQERLPDESDEDFNSRVEFSREQTERVLSQLEDTDQLTFGVTIDSEARRVLLDVATTVVPDSDSARQIANYAMADKSTISGFLRPDAAARMHANGKIGPEEIDNIKAAVQGAREKIMHEIGMEESLADPQARQVVETMLNTLVDVIESTIEEGKTSGGFLVVGEGPFTAVMGGVVADGEKLEALAKQLLDMAGMDPEVPQLTIETTQHGDLKIQSAVVPTSGAQNEEQLKALLGDELRIAAAFGADRFFVGIGPECVDVIRQVVDDSAAGADEETLPFSMSFAVGPFLNFAAMQEPGDPMMAMLAAGLSDVDNDHIHLTAQFETNGQSFRVEIEEGILKLIGAAAALGAQNAGVAPPF